MSGLSRAKMKCYEKVTSPYCCFRCGDSINPLSTFKTDTYGIIYCLPCHIILWLGDTGERGKRLYEVH